MSTRRKLVIAAALVAVAALLLALLGYAHWRRPPAPRLFDRPFEARGLVLAARPAADATDVPASGALVVAFPADLDWTALRLDELERVDDCALFVTTHTSSDGTFAFSGLDGAREWFALAFADGGATYPLVPLPLLPDELHNHHLGPLIGAGVRFVDANGEPHRELRYVRGIGDALLAYPLMPHLSFAPAPQLIDRSWFEALLLLATGVDRAHRDADTHWLIEHAADLSLTVERGSAVADVEPPGFVCDRTSRSFELLYLPFEPLGDSLRAVDVWAMPTAPATGSLTIEWSDDITPYELAQSRVALVLESRSFDDGIFVDLDRLARHGALANGVAIVDGVPAGTYTVAAARRSAGSYWEYDRSVSVSGANSVTITENGCASVLLERPSHAALQLRRPASSPLLAFTHGVRFEGSTSDSHCTFDPTFRRIVGIPPGRWTVTPYTIFPDYLTVSDSPPWIVPHDPRGFWTLLAASFLPAPPYADEPRGFQFDLEPGEIEVATWLEFVR